MKRFSVILTWLAIGCAGRDVTAPRSPAEPAAASARSVSCDPAATAIGAAEASSCRNVEGHVAGQLIGPSPLCGGGPAEVGTFTGAGGGTFVACITAMEQKGNGSLRFELIHTYKTTSGATFTTTDRVVAAPTGRPSEYLINNQVRITGGTGELADASGFLRTHGTVNLATGVVSVDYHGRLCTP
jgi:hypothetical protein